MRLTKETVAFIRAEETGGQRRGLIFDLLDTIDALESLIAELEGIDKACDAANRHVVLLQAQIDRTEQGMTCNTNPSERIPIK